MRPCAIFIAENALRVQGITTLALARHPPIGWSRSGPCTGVRMLLPSDQLGAVCPRVPEPAGAHGRSQTHRSLSKDADQRILARDDEFDVLAREIPEAVRG